MWGDNLRKRLKDKTFEMCVLESLNLENVRKYENILEENNNLDAPEFIMNDIKQFFNVIKPNNIYDKADVYTSEKDYEENNVILDPVERLAMDIESGLLENTQSEETDSSSDSDNELDDILNTGDDDDVIDIDTINSVMV